MELILNELIKKYRMYYDVEIEKSIDLSHFIDFIEESIGLYPDIDAQFK